MIVFTGPSEHTTFFHYDHLASQGLGPDTALPILGGVSVQFDNIAVSEKI